MKWMQYSSTHSCHADIIDGRKLNEGGVASSGMVFIKSFMKLRQFVHKLLERTNTLMDTREHGRHTINLYSLIQ
jgi:hypothetical protein